MDVIKAMRAFTEVAQKSGFAPAARSLGISTSSVSRQVIELEEWLGLTLIQRTTRRLSLTEEGVFYLNECQQILDDVNRMRATATEIIDQPKGTLKVTAPVFLAKECILRVLPEFLAFYPNITLELTALDRFVDLVEEGFDVAIRVGELPDSSLVMRRLGELHLIAVASDDYLSARGIPATPADLIKHNCIVDEVASFANRWPFRIQNRRQRVRVSGNIKVNNGEIARDLAVAGVGVALLPDFFVRDTLRMGDLVEVLQDQVDSSIGLYSVYPQSKHVPIKVRAFIDFVVDYLHTFRKN
ncbi:MAG: LysR family transcriptional regulator [Pseudomonadota bacterium]